MKVLYARVSTNDGTQNIDRQLVNKEEYGKIFIDYASGSTADRPKLQELIDWIRECDVVEVHSIDRLARNLEDLLRLIRIITEEKEAEIYFIKENLRFYPEKSEPISKMILQIMGSIAEFERSMILERQREGIALAKARGVYSRSRNRQPKLSVEQIKEIKEAILKPQFPRIKVSELSRKYGVSRTSIYKYLKMDNVKESNV